ncbi:hypothetical protein PITC_082140 [Penicillium italicum]|uniref:Uncharacterized protein n=1 Tax=Penicillium italicum TaxID=40296 RepID=A0A0A2L5X2_PENIT|nr:hypothetical protein PITC_082140 [Penicillium italicum]
MILGKAVFPGYFDQTYVEKMKKSRVEMMEVSTKRPF